MPGFSTDLAPSEKANSLPDDVPIYYYGGHGEDMCNPVTHELIMETVPEDCIYITIGECGFTTGYDTIAKFLPIFRDPSEKARTLLRYPYLFENLKEISEETGVSIDNLHIHLPGSKYVASKIYPPLSWNTPLTYIKKSGYFGMLFSGISEKKALEKVSKSVEPFLLDKFEAHLDERSLKKLVDSEDKKDLFKKLKTVFASDPQGSRLLQGVGAEGLLNRMFPENGEKQIWKGSIIRYMNELGYAVPTDTFLAYFQASVFPTQEILRNIVSTKTAGLKDGILYGFDIDNIAKTLEGAFADKDFTVSEIMRKYPGIHYNLVCRVVSDACYEKTMPQRVISQAEEQERRKTYRATSPTEKFKADISQFRFENITDINIIFTFIKENRDYIVTLPNTKTKDLITKIGVSLTHDLREEKGLDIFTDIYTLLYPLKDSYSLNDLKNELARDLGLMGSIYSYINMSSDKRIDSTSLVSSRVKEYVSRLNKETIKNVSPDEKDDIVARVRAYLDDKNSRESFLNMLKEKPVVSAPISVPINRSRQRPSQTQSQSRGPGPKFGPLYTSLVARVDAILERDYPKAKNERNLLYTKQGAIYNTLVGIKDSFARLSKQERQALINYLVSKQIVRTDAKDPMISKRIKYIIMPEIYPNPQAGGKWSKTRKHRSKKTKRMTRKQ
jgi:hypothetical protein